MKVPIIKRRVPQESIILPSEWGNDSLSDFIKKAYENRLATFENKKGWFKRLADIDACFMRVANGWTNPSHLITPFFFFRANAAFRAACEHAMSGQAADTYPQVRVCIEYAGYGLHIHKNVGLAEIWLKREESDEALNEVKENFKIGAIKKTLKKENSHAEAVFGLLYDRAIKFGAHPNEASVVSNLKIKEERGERHYLQTQLHGDGLEMEHALKTTAQAGICALDVLSHAFSARFELLGIHEKLAKLKKDL